MVRTWTITIGIGVGVVVGLAAGSRLGEPAAQPPPTRPSPFFRSSFEDSSAPAIAPFVAQWHTAEGTLALVPRRSRTGTLGLFGSLPTGRYEGALWLANFDGRVWRGEYAAARSLERLPVEVEPAAEAAAIIVRIGNTTLSFSRSGTASARRLARIAIIGHRAASLGHAKRENTIAAINDAWLFGASGIEIDVTVPYAANREPLPNRVRVYHPPEWRAELTGFDGRAEADMGDAPDLRSALRAAEMAGLHTVYLDPKLRWLMADRRPAARQALTSMVGDAMAVRDLSVVIGGETSGVGEAADMLAELRRAGAWPDRIRWALEITRGTDLRRAQSRLNSGNADLLPGVMSWNLLRLDGGGGGWLRWFVPTIAPEFERALTAFDGPLVVWTANDADQFAPALEAVARLQRHTSDAAVMTPYVHRLAFFLACES